MTNMVLNYKTRPALAGFIKYEIEVTEIRPSDFVL